jgi:hypothetical protein
VTVSATWGFVERVIPIDRRRGAMSPGSSLTGPKAPRPGRGAPTNPPSSGVVPILPPHPDPELLGGGGTAASVGATLRPCWGTSVWLWAGSSTALGADQAFVVERILP